VDGLEAGALDVEWNLRNRLDAARNQRKDKADDERTADDDAPVASSGPVRVDYRTVRTVRETQEAQVRARREAEARAAEEQAQRRYRPAPVIPLTGRPTPSVPSPDGAPATVTTIMRAAIASTEPIITTRPAQERCPNCGGGVRIEMFDLVQAVAHLSCIDCGLVYTAKSPSL
jgi:hypothetical protein